MNARLKKSLAVAGVASGISLAVIAGTGAVSAATSTDDKSTNPESSLIDKLVSKFGLNKSDVQAVFDEEHTAREAEHQQRVEERLTQAVTDGKITEDQKTKILAKMKEIKADMEANRDSMKDKTQAERKADMEAKRAELEKWASDNNIPTEYLRMGMMGGHGGPGGPGGDRGGPGQDDGQSDDQSSDTDDSSNSGSSSSSSTN